MSKKKLWDLEKIAEAAHETAFWRTEYLKRKLILSKDYGSYDTLVDRYNKFCNKWHEYLDKQGNVPQVYKKDFMKHLQYSSMCMSLGQIYDDVPNNFKFMEHFEPFLKDPDVQKELSFFGHISFEYGYALDDLLSPVDMTSLLKSVDVEAEVIVPKPPVLFIKNRINGKFSREVLRCMRHFDRNEEISILTCNFWKQLLRLAACRLDSLGILTREMDKQYSQLKEFVEEHSFITPADFVITGQALHSDFDIDVAVAEIKDHLIELIYGQKHQHGLELTDREHELAADFYRRRTMGKSNRKHTLPRAIGLWLWDRISSSSCSVSQAIRDLRDLGFDRLHSGSDERTFRRMLDTAERCIEAGDVLASS